MLYKRPGSPYWQVKVVIGGRRLRVSTQTTDKRQAAAVEARLRERHWQQVRGGQHTWVEACDRWLDERGHKKSANRDKSIIDWTLDPSRLRDCLLSEITSDKIAALRKAKAEETTLATANRHFALIRAILRACRDDWEWLAEIPKVPMYKAEAADYQWLTRAEFEALLPHLPPHARQLARFAVATGLRRTNITHLRWSQVDLKRQHVHVRSRETKAGRGLAVPLNADALAVLEEQAAAEKPHEVWVFPYRGEPVFQVATKAWREAVKAIKRPGLRFHDLRHTWASWHVQAGTPLHALQALGGWASPTLVARYGHHDARSLAHYAQAVATPKATQRKRAPRKAA